ncbi:hypothetical protein FACS1894217_01570 [Clostridia bacterium]|nr:hypothetical protein FACS1894217_01570 [Clostridia bacterium]
MNRKNRVVAMLLAVSMMVSIFGTMSLAGEAEQSYIISNSVIANATTIMSAMTTDRTYEVEAVKPLLGFSDEPEYALVTFKGKGYAIISLLTEQIIEALPDGENPYQGVSGEEYYAGPMNYIYADNSGDLFDVEDNHELSDEEIALTSEQVDKAIEENLAATSTPSRGSLVRATPASAMVTNSDYIINSMSFGKNVNGTCGSVAAGMMLTYIDKYVVGTGKVVPLSMPYGETLHKSLVPYCEGKSGSTSETVATGINKWITANASNSYNVKKAIKADYFYLLWGGYAKSSIAANKPVVLALTGGYPKHQVLAYGYYKNANGEYYMRTLVGMTSREPQML